MTYSWSGGSTFTANYSYNNLPAQTGDYWSEYQLAGTPVAYIKTDHGGLGHVRIIGRDT